MPLKDVIERTQAFQGKGTLDFIVRQLASDRIAALQINFSLLVALKGWGDRGAPGYDRGGRLTTLYFENRVRWVMGNDNKKHKVTQKYQRAMYLCWLALAREE